MPKLGWAVGSAAAFGLARCLDSNQRLGWRRGQCLLGRTEATRAWQTLRPREVAVLFAKQGLGGGRGCRAAAAATCHRRPVTPTTFDAAPASAVMVLAMVVAAAMGAEAALVLRGL